MCICIYIYKYVHTHIYNNIYIYHEVITRFYRLAWRLTTTTGSWCLFPSATEVCHTTGHRRFNTDNTTEQQHHTHTPLQHPAIAKAEGARRAKTEVLRTRRASHNCPPTVLQGNTPKANTLCHHPKGITAHAPVCYHPKGITTREACSQLRPRCAMQALHASNEG